MTGKWSPEFRAAFDAYWKIKHADYKAWWALRGSDIPTLSMHRTVVALSETAAERKAAATVARLIVHQW